ncbi:unnamed protein product [Alternaria alternata]
MEKFQRGHPAPERTRNRSGTMTGDKAIAKKRSSLGKAAGGFQSRFLASLRSKKKNDADEELALNPSRDLGHIRPRSRIGYHVRTTGGITNQERKILKNLDAPLRLQYFYMYCFIVQVLLRKLRPSSRTGAVEKFLRGWSNQPACSEDIAFLLILGGTGQIAKLLACPMYSDRRRYLLAYRTHMSPHTSKCWRRHWKDAGVVSPALLDDIPCTQIGITQLDQIWVPLIAHMMEPGARNFTEQERIRYDELKMSKKFINEVMGYDILRGRAADGGESDDEHEP